MAGFGKRADLPASLPEPAIGLSFINAVYQLLNVAVIKRIAAFGAELRRLDTLFGFPTALVALVLRNTSGFLRTAFGTELAAVHTAAFRAEPFSGFQRILLIPELLLADLLNKRFLGNIIHIGTVQKMVLFFVPVTSAKAEQTEEST